MGHSGVNFAGWGGYIKQWHLLHGHVEFEPVFRCDFSHVLHSLSAVAIDQAHLCKRLQEKSNNHTGTSNSKSSTPHSLWATSSAWKTSRSHRSLRYEPIHAIWPTRTWKQTRMHLNALMIYSHAHSSWKCSLVVCQLVVFTQLLAELGLTFLIALQARSGHVREITSTNLFYKAARNQHTYF